MKPNKGTVATIKIPPAVASDNFFDLSLRSIRNDANTETADLKINGDSQDVRISLFVGAIDVDQFRNLSKHATNALGRRRAFALIFVSTYPTKGGIRIGFGLRATLKLAANLRREEHLTTIGIIAKLVEDLLFLRRRVLLPNAYQGR